MNLWHFFDKLEDAIRGRLSHYPILYGFVTGVGAVLFFRGVWHLADGVPWMNGAVSVAIGAVTLMLTGVFVSHFVSDRIILSGLKKEKKFVERMRESEREEISHLQEIRNELREIKTSLHLRGPRNKRDREDAGQG